MGTAFTTVRCDTCEKVIYGNSHSSINGCRCDLCYYRFDREKTTKGICDIDGCTNVYYSTNHINICIDHWKTYFLQQNDMYNIITLFNNYII